MRTSHFFFSGDLGSAQLFVALFDGREKSFTRECAITRLRARILHGHADSSGAMSQRHRSRDLVHMLTPRAAGTREPFLKIRFADIQARHLPIDRLHVHAAADGRTRTGTGRLKPNGF